MRVLLVEDDTELAASVELMLRRQNIEVFTAELGERGINLAQAYDLDIILLDLNLPDMSGYELLRSLRAMLIETPVLILSGLASVADKVRALGLGADDYVTKPFHHDELLARIKATVRRSVEQRETVVRCGDLAVRLGAKRAEISGMPVNLSVKEYSILELMAARQGSVLTKEMFLNALYGGMDEPEIKIIDVFICKLRKKLAEASGGKDYIETTWGRGYALRPPEEVRPTAETRAA